MLLLFGPGFAPLPKALKEYDQNKAKPTRKVISSECALASFLILRTDCDIAAS